MNEGMNERTKEPTFIEHLCANLCFVRTTALSGWSVITPQSRKRTEVQRGAAICPGSHATRAGLGQTSDVLGLAPLAASLHGDRKISLHATAVDRLSHCPWLITLAAHVWSHLQPSNSPWQSMWDFGSSVFPSPACGLLGPGTISDSTLGTKQLLNKRLLNEWTHEE